MNYPEVWEFKSNLKAPQLETFNSNSDVAEKLSSKTSSAKMVSLLLPDTDTSRLVGELKRSDYYSCENFELKDVLTKNFREGFLKNGNFSCISADNTSFDDNFLISNNKLILNLHKESLQSVSGVLLNQQKHHLNGEFQKFEIDLMNEKLEISKLASELNDLFQKSSVNFVWNPSSDDICPSSIAKYFSDAGREIKLSSNRILNVSEYALTFPTIPTELDAYSFSEISEYIGMILLRCCVEKNDFSSYMIPNDCIDVGRGSVIHCKGFITRHTIKNLINEIRTILDENPAFPWIAMSIAFHSSLKTESKLLIITKDKVFTLK